MLCGISVSCGEILKHHCKHPDLMMLDESVTLNIMFQFETLNENLFVDSLSEMPAMSLPPSDYVYHRWTVMIVAASECSVLPDGTRNACHGSDSPASAARELEFFFPASGTGPSNTATFTDCTCCVIKPHAVSEGKYHSPCLSGSRDAIVKLAVSQIVLISQALHILARASSKAEFTV